MLLQSCRQFSMEKWLQLMVLIQVGCVCYGYFMARSNLWCDFPIKNGEITPKLLHAPTWLRRTWMQMWKITKQRGDFVHAVFSWWFSLGAKSLLLSRLCYTKTIVQKSGVCSAIHSLLLGSSGQLLNPIKYLPFSTKHYSMWLLSLLKTLWKKGKLHNAACGKNSSAAFSLWCH